jgi:hypothetical protein
VERVVSHDADPDPVAKTIELLVRVARSYARRSSDWRMLVRFE